MDQCAAWVTALPRNRRPVGIVGGTGQASGGLYAGVLQSYVVTPNEAAKDLEFIRYNIDATRRAYALDRVEERELSGDAALTPAQIVANVGTIQNVRLWDHDQLLQSSELYREIVEKGLPDQVFLTLAPTEREVSGL